MARRWPITHSSPATNGPPKRWALPQWGAPVERKRGFKGDEWQSRSRAGYERVGRRTAEGGWCPRANDEADHSPTNDPKSEKGGRSQPDGIRGQGEKKRERAGGEGVTR